MDEAGFVCDSGGRFILKVSNMTDDLIIDPEFEGELVPLSEQAYAGLEASILEEGCRDPIVAWGRIVVDGHHRKKICNKHGLPFKVVQREFANRDDALRWINANQANKRNLTPDQLSIVRGRIYNRAKRQHGNEGGELDRTKSLSGQNDHLKKTAEKLADQCGVSPKTIRRDEKKYLMVEEMKKSHPQAAAAVLSGEKRIREVRREIKGEGKRSVGREIIDSATEIRDGLKEEKRGRQYPSLFPQIKKTADELYGLTRAKAHCYPFMQVHEKAKELMDMCSKAFGLD
jgi:ParB-like chromosome segregation protein Spo0J